MEVSDVFRRLTLEVIGEVTLGLPATDTHVLPRYVVELPGVPAALLFSRRSPRSQPLIRVCVVHSLFVSVLDEMNLRVYHPYRAFLPSNLEHKRVRELLHSPTLTSLGVSGVYAVHPYIYRSPNRQLTRIYRHVQKIHELDTIVLEVIRQRNAARQDPSAVQTLDRTENEDLLDMLLDHLGSDEENQMDERQLADELKTMLLAGHETSSTMLTWTMYLLAKNPEAMQKVRSTVLEWMTVDEWPTGLLADLYSVK